MATVLIVDDEPSLVTPLRFLMEQHGHAVCVVTDGAEVVPAVRSHRPDLVLLDINLPSRDGYEVCEALRAEPNADAVRIVMLTVNSREVDRERGLALGADAYITKPFGIQEVIDRVESLLSSR